MVIRNGETAARMRVGRKQVGPALVVVLIRRQFARQLAAMESVWERRAVMTVTMLMVTVAQQTVQWKSAGSAVIV